MEATMLSPVGAQQGQTKLTAQPTAWNQIPAAPRQTSPRHPRAAQP